MGWNDSGFTRRRADNAASSGFSPRQAEGRKLVSGDLSRALTLAIRARAASDGTAVSTLLSSIRIGGSTWTRMNAGKSIAQDTVLKIVRYLGTDVRSVLTKYQRSQSK